MPMTFRVNLETVNYLSDKTPYDNQRDTGFSARRSTWFPNNALANRELSHGDTFTASGREALYLKNNFTTGTFKFLDYVSGTSV